MSLLIGSTASSQQDKTQVPSASELFNTAPSEVSMELQKSNGTMTRTINLGQAKSLSLTAKARLTKGMITISVKSNTEELLNKTFSILDQDQPVQLELKDLNYSSITITTTMQLASGHYEMSWS
jgi:hypothetical protein